MGRFLGEGIDSKLGWLMFPWLLFVLFGCEPSDDFRDDLLKALFNSSIFNRRDPDMFLDSAVSTADEEFSETGGVKIFSETSEIM